MLHIYNQNSIDMRLVLISECLYTKVIYLVHVKQVVHVEHKMYKIEHVESTIHSCAESLKCRTDSVCRVLQELRK